jgi:hypothetical protein
MIPVTWPWRRPGGNVTGFSTMEPSIVGKMLVEAGPIGLGISLQ